MATTIFPPRPIAQIPPALPPWRSEEWRLTTLLPSTADLRTARIAVGRQTPPPTRSHLTSSSYTCLTTTLDRRSSSSTDTEAHSADAFHRRRSPNATFQLAVSYPTPPSTSSNPGHH
ncbi:Os03g0663350 [Oryza sativa Japonica Group]|uniref:Os03g0663350 protein n=1 Tax=Oryza sativa subsp. japonica TaxID=39947 RepID=A0A0P0W128_ORYSJ|nr:Os03g0663350 [Oryza sativa Japonica Group]